MRWEKIGVTTVSTPTSHGGGLVLRVKKDLVDAYNLWEADKVEFRLERVKRPAEKDSTFSIKRGGSKRRGGGEG